MASQQDCISNDTSETVDPAVMVFDAALVKQLSSTEIRLPPNFVGVRRVRSKFHKPKQSNSATLNIAFRVKDESGVERRMTRQEKKELKKTLASEKKQAKKRGLQDDTTTNHLKILTSSAQAGDTPKTPKIYHQLDINASVLEQELAELRGERSGLPPAILSPAMAMQAKGILPGSLQRSEERYLKYDESLSMEWAKLLKESMSPAEKVRVGEDMRPMAYQLTPEPWERLRPNRSEKRIETRICPVNFEALQSNDRTSLVQKKCKWAELTCRPPSTFDMDVSVVFEYLHRETAFFVSCGAKFGSDFLIYDGPREERHAFAGMRVLSAKDGLPLPTAYSLAGYVRCLNKAGKLALLATTVKDNEVDGKSLYRVALVDVALEKILSAPTHKKRARTEVRRDVTQNLAKR